MWVRGLKQFHQLNYKEYQKVAPHVGAWIETSSAKCYRYCAWSHPMWVRGLKRAQFLKSLRF